ncbi:hypothetical protein [Geminisphaera colitermitum]|uniref:hypothetical protein n=1 Tax=Geminisphaera colitermitum TaxID=1148786 RepID=UPI000158D022|nr:hypothetical protein [Geminisphaera colitermitum]
MTTHNQIDPFHILREAQARSAQEQQLLSGRDWLSVTALVQFLTALYPLYLWVSFDLLGYRLASTDPLVSILRLTALVTFGIGFVFLLLSWWAKYAPFRAATLALVFYTALNVFFALTRPQHFMDGIASRMFVFLGLIMAVRTGFHRHRAK